MRIAGFPPASVPRDAMDPAVAGGTGTPRLPESDRDAMEIELTSEGSPWRGTLRLWCQGAEETSAREHACMECGLIPTRDHASTAEILRLELSLQRLTVVP